MNNWRGPFFFLFRISKLYCIPAVIESTKLNHYTIALKSLLFPCQPFWAWCMCVKMFPRHFRPKNTKTSRGCAHRLDKIQSSLGRGTHAFCFVFALLCFIFTPARGAQSKNDSMHADGRAGEGVKNEFCGSAPPRASRPNLIMLMDELAGASHTHTIDIDTHMSLQQCTQQSST